MGENLLAGYDGSACSRWALEWAAVEAMRRGGRLVVVAVVDHASLADCPAAQLVRRWHILRARAGALAADAVRLVRAVAPGLELDVLSEVGAPVGTLVAASRRCDLLVLGAPRRPGRVTRRHAVLIEAVAAHARCPVLVVGSAHAEHPGPARPVVVGVDQSGPAEEILTVAAAAASATGAPLHAVCVWSHALPPSRGRSHSPGTALDEAGARCLAEAAVEQARAAHPEVRASAVARAGYPPAVLVRLARGAGLLVVGRRSFGEPSSLVVGPVARTALRALPCPVAIVGPARVRQARRPAVAPVRLVGVAEGS